jgi:glutamate-1-semialdehyde 2,1-aminomutase
VNKSEELFGRAQRKIPGGVNSPVRAWQAVGGAPRVIARGNGSCLLSVDGDEYIDFVTSWGPLILGHAHPQVTKSLKIALEKGTTFGAPTVGEIELAEIVCDRVPSIEKLRLVSSGTEAAMSAIRLARAFTNRSKVVKFDGCYHGHSDGLLVRAGSGVATLALPDSAGVPASFAAETLVVPYNDIKETEAVFEKARNAIAAVIVEPVCGNMGVIPPAQGFLEALREISKEHGAILIFDEVITGFRVAPGGAQDLYGVVPDLTCLGKILGGGLPLAAFGGKKEIMDLLAPEGPVYQAGTLSGNPLAVAAGLTTLKELARRGAYSELEKKGQTLQQGFEKILNKHKISGIVNRVGSMLTLFFGVGQVRDAADARQCDKERFARFFHGMLKRGFYFPPSPFEAAFISLAHREDDLKKAVEAFGEWAREESRS